MREALARTEAEGGTWVAETNVGGMRPLAEGRPGGPVGGEPGGRRAAGPGSLVFGEAPGKGGGIGPEKILRPASYGGGRRRRRFQVRWPTLVVGGAAGGGAGRRRKRRRRRRLGGGGKNRPGPDARRLSTFGRRPVRRAGGRRAAGPGALFFGERRGMRGRPRRRLWVRFEPSSAVWGRGGGVGGACRGASVSLVCKASEGPYRRGAAGGGHDARGGGARGGDRGADGINVTKWGGG